MPKSYGEMAGDIIEFDEINAQEETIAWNVEPYEIPKDLDDKIYEIPKIYEEKTNNYEPSHDNYVTTENYNNNYQTYQPVKKETYKPTYKTTNKSYYSSKATEKPTTVVYHPKPTETYPRTTKVYPKTTTTYPKTTTPYPKTTKTYPKTSAPYLRKTKPYPKTTTYTTSTTTYTTTTTKTTYTKPYKTTTKITTPQLYNHDNYKETKTVRPTEPQSDYKTYPKPVHVTTKAPYVPFKVPIVPTAPEANPLEVVPYNKYTDHDPMVPSSHDTMVHNSLEKTDSPNIHNDNYYTTPHSYPTKKYTTPYPTTREIYEETNLPQIKPYEPSHPLYEQKYEEKENNIPSNHHKSGSEQNRQEPTDTKIESKSFGEILPIINEMNSGSPTVAHNLDKYPEGPKVAPRKQVWFGDLTYQDPLKEQQEESKNTTPGQQ